MMGAIAVMTGLRGGRAAAGLRARAGRGWRSGTSYSEIGITGITPIPGLFRYPFLRARKRPGTWADALWCLPPVGIIRCVSCADGTSSAALPAHGDGAAMFVRTGGSIG